MISIGEQLKTARERMGLDLERVSGDTNIAKRFLAALEEENFSVFPGDPYAIGFIRNYAEYLGLEPGDLITAFKNMRIQEQPVPMESLIPRRGPSPWIFALGGAAVAAVVVLILLLTGKPGASEIETIVENAVRTPTEYALDTPTLEKRFYEGDTLLVPLGNEKYRLLIAKISDRVTLESPIGRTLFMMGEQGTIDLDKDANPELQVFVNDFQKGDASKGALITFSVAGELAQAFAEPALEPALAAPADSETLATETPLPDAEPMPLPGGPEPVVIFDQVASPFPIVITTIFRNYCMFRYEVDRRDREERYYHKGDQITVNVTNTIKLWTSNAAASKTTVQATGGRSADLDLGGQGEVAVKHIRWIQAEGGSWNLVLVDVP